MKGRNRSGTSRTQEPSGESFFAKEGTSLGFFDSQMSSPFFSAAPQSIQRKCADCKDEEKHSNQAAAAAQHKPEPPLQNRREEDHKISRKESSKAPTTAPTAGLSGVDGSGGSALPSGTASYFSNSMGYDLNEVRVHTGSQADRSARAINAKAYTIGQHIVFRDGQFQPETQAGKWLLAHELTHVAQQKGDRIRRQADETEEAAIPTIFNSGTGPVEYANQRDYGNCEGVKVQGHADANYNDTYSFSSSGKQAEGCEGCAPEECVHTTGTIVSVFGANPSVTLPSVPSGLNDCETAAVQNFINTTLAAHEQEHVAAFNTFLGTVKTPYSYTGCRSGEAAYVQTEHNKIKLDRMAASNAASALLDPFNEPIPCDCPDKKEESAEPDAPAEPAPESEPEAE